MVHLVNARTRPGSRRVLPVGVFASGGHALNHLDESYEVPGEEGPARPDVLDHAYVLVDFDNGSRGCLEISMFAEASANQLEVSIVGDGGKLEAFMPSHGDKTVDDKAANVRIARRADELRSRTWQSTRPPPVEFTKGRVEEVAEHPDPRLVAAGDHHGSTFEELHSVIKAVNRKARAADVSIADSIVAIACGIAAHESIETHRKVLIKELVDVERLQRLFNLHDARRG